MLMFTVCIERLKRFTNGDFFTASNTYENKPKDGRYINFVASQNYETLH